MRCAWLLLLAAIGSAACSEETRPPTQGEPTLGTGSGPSGGPGSGGSGQGGGGAGGASAQGWEELAPLLSPLQENGVVALAGEIYVIGGFDALAEVVARVEVYDPIANSWRSAAPLPQPRHHVNAAVVGGKIYVLGSLAGLGFAAQGDVWIYDPALDTWDVGQNMPAGSERGGGGVGVSDNTIYVAGGYRDGSVADFSAYDTLGDSWSTLPALPALRDHLVGGFADGRFFAIGGRAGGIGGITDRVDAFDPGASSWQSVAPLPTARGGGMTAIVAGRIFVLGGEGNSQSPVGVFDDVEAYDPSSDTWEVLPPMRTPRHGTGAAAIEGVIYVPGGATEQAFGAVDVNEALTP